MLLSKCALRDWKKLRFIKEQEASELLSNLGIKNLSVKFLISEMHLIEPGFKYSTCGPFAKNKERIKRIKETGYSRYIYQNELNKACF